MFGRSRMCDCAVVGGFSLVTSQSVLTGNTRIHGTGRTHRTRGGTPQYIHIGLNDKAKHRFHNVLLMGSITNQLKEQDDEGFILDI